MGGRRSVRTPTGGHSASGPSWVEHRIAPGLERGLRREVGGVARCADGRAQEQPEELVGLRIGAGAVLAPLASAVRGGARLEVDLLADVLEEVGRRQQRHRVSVLGDTEDWDVSQSLAEGGGEGRIPGAGRAEGVALRHVVAVELEVQHRDRGQGAAEAMARHQQWRAPVATDGVEVPLDVRGEGPVVLHEARADAAGAAAEATSMHVAQSDALQVLHKCVDVVGAPEGDHATPTPSAHVGMGAEREIVGHAYALHIRHVSARATVPSVADMRAEGRPGQVGEFQRLIHREARPGGHGSGGGQGGQRVLGAR
mmetsp:Transcript_26786/g.53593  ORF Transcript_26786/g.53593 Transcript_26786/m.53593 type:complete len:312 (+) Transcript_26786:101-1036(+)